MIDASDGEKGNGKKKKFGCERRKTTDLVFGRSPACRRSSKQEKGKMKTDGQGVTSPDSPKAPRLLAVPDDCGDMYSDLLNLSGKKAGGLRTVFP